VAIGTATRLLGTLCAAAVLAACGGSPDRTTPGEDGVTPVVFVGPAAATPSTLNLQSNLFVEGGYAAEHGLKATLQTAPGPQALAALQSGQNDFVLTNQATVFSAVNSGAKFKIIAGYGMTFPTAIVTRKDITAVGQLAGKTVAVSSLGDVPQIYTNAYLSGSGLVDPASVKYSGAGNYANAMAYLTGGKADAAWVLVANLPTVLKNPDLHVLVTPEEFARFAPSAGTVVVVTEEFANTHRDLVQKVVDMVVGGSRKLYEDENGYVELVRKVLPNVYSDGEAHEQYQRLRPALAVNGGMDSAVLKSSYGLWLKYTAPDGGKSVKLVDATTAFDTSFAATSVRKLGLVRGVMDSGDLLGTS